MRWGPRRGLPTANATFHDRRLPAPVVASIIYIPETVAQGPRPRGVARSQFSVQLVKMVEVVELLVEAWIPGR